MPTPSDNVNPPVNRLHCTRRHTRAKRGYWTQPTGATALKSAGHHDDDDHTDSNVCDGVAEA